MSEEDELVKVKKFNEVGQDERGLTAEFLLPRKQAGFVFIQRKAGSFSGNAYHTGQNSSTNPKVFLVLQGELLFQYRATDSTQKQEIYVKSPALLEVKPFVIHAVKALTDIVMLECNSIAEIQNDRIKQNV